MFNLFKTRKRIKAENIDKESFDTEIMLNKKSAIVTFSADWCGACKMQKPLLHDVADHHRESSVLVAVVDIDSQNELSSRFGVSSIPMTIAFKNGEPVFKKTGVLSRRNLEEIMAELKTSE